VGPGEYETTKNIRTECKGGVIGRGRRFRREN